MFFFLLHIIVVKFISKKFVEISFQCCAYTYTKYKKVFIKGLQQKFIFGYAKRGNIILLLCQSFLIKLLKTFTTGKICRTIICVMLKTSMLQKIKFFFYNKDLINLIKITCLFRELFVASFFLIGRSLLPFFGVLHV